MLLYTICAPDCPTTSSVKAIQTQLIIHHVDIPAFICGCCQWPISAAIIANTSIAAPIELSLGHGRVPKLFSVLYVQGDACLMVNLIGFPCLDGERLSTAHRKELTPALDITFQTSKDGSPELARLIRSCEVPP